MIVPLWRTHYNFIVNDLWGTNEIWIKETDRWYTIDDSVFVMPVLRSSSIGTVCCMQSILFITRRDNCCCFCCYRHTAEFIYRRMASEQTKLLNTALNYYDIQRYCDCSIRYQLCLFSSFLLISFFYEFVFALLLNCWYSQKMGNCNAKIDRATIETTTM